MDQGIRLGTQLDTSKTASQDGPRDGQLGTSDAEVSENVPRRDRQPGISDKEASEAVPRERLFTVADVFGVKGEVARHVTLVSYGTASQTIA